MSERPEKDSSDYLRMAQIIMNTPSATSSEQPLNDCPYCDESVMTGEPRNQYMNDSRWHHWECFARPILGSVAHIEGRCHCRVPGSHEGDAPGLTKRQAAQASIDAYRRAHPESDRPQR